MARSTKNNLARARPTLSLKAMKKSSKTAAARSHAKKARQAKIKKETKTTIEQLATSAAVTPPTSPQRCTKVRPPHPLAKFISQNTEEKADSDFEKSTHIQKAWDDDEDSNASNIMSADLAHNFYSKVEITQLHIPPPATTCTPKFFSRVEIIELQAHASASVYGNAST
ncbi:hypothetical protein BT69DRAFT_1385930 [Atractiella rhizophila]|nr:hypothetical protein BT69DRAFT_1385930 [Atractiella rhizophila]